jgi:predicted RNA-binding protein
MPEYWLFSVTPENFLDLKEDNFPSFGFPHKSRKLAAGIKSGDKCVLYISKRQKLGVICQITSGTYSDEDEDYPLRVNTQPELILTDEELLDVKKLVPQLGFITPKQKTISWGVAFQSTLRRIPEEDFRLIESEMRKIKSEPTLLPPEGFLTEEQAKQAILQLPLEKNSLHDRIGEMLETIGSRMGYNAYTGYKVTPEHAVELDVAWLQGKNPEVAIEIQIGGNIVEAKDKLAQAKKFNYRKIIMVIEESQLSRLNAIVKFDEIIYWMDAWSIQAVYKLYTSGISFLRLYDQLKESRYKKKTEVEFVRE